MFENYNFENFNYLEIDFLNYNEDTAEVHENIIDVNWLKTDFINFLDKIMKSNKSFGLKNNVPFEKQFRVLKYQSLNYVKNLSDNKINLFSLSLVDEIDKDFIKKNMVCIKYKKENMAIFQFPSTSNLNDTYYLNRIIFKITNLIFLNFEIMKKNEIEIFYRVYINFNNDKKNLEYSVIIKNLEDIIVKIKNLIN